jgi:hypothetical protein
MTSEVLLMNRGAVAMAADSAVTVMSGRGETHAIYKSYDKVYQLIDGAPVGIMFYNNVDIMNVPWETIISLYGVEAAGRRFNTVEDYALDFLSFVEKHKDLFPQEHQDLEFFKNVAVVFGLIADEFDKEMENLRDTSSQDVKTHFSSVFQFVVEEIYSAYTSYFDETPRQNLPCFPGDTGKKLSNRYNRQIEELIDSLEKHLSSDYSGLSFSPETRNRLEEIATMTVTKNAFFEGYTGLVFAGFGEREKFPAMVSYHTGGVFNGILKRATDRESQVDANGGPVMMTFAQDKMIYTFLTGIDRDFRQYLFLETLRLTHHLIADLISGLGSLNPDEKQRLFEQYSEENLTQALNAFFSKIEAYQQAIHTTPIIRALHTLPRTELAETAASLVKLNSFQQKVMQQPETVGGPVDVALISLSEGFVLIRDGGNI